MARKQKYSAAEVAEALHKTQGVVVQAARLLGCTSRTVYNYADRYVTVEEAMKEGRAELYAYAQGSLVAILKDRDHPQHKWAIDRVLEAFGPAVDDGVVWSEKKRLEHSGPDKGPIPHQWGPPRLDPDDLDWDEAEQSDPGADSE